MAAVRGQQMMRAATSDGNPRGPSGPKNRKIYDAFHYPNPKSLKIANSMKFCRVRGFLLKFQKESVKT
jgi:hypothetical protein